MQIKDLIAMKIQIEDTLCGVYGARPPANIAVKDNHGLVNKWDNINDKIREMQDKELSEYGY